MVDIAIAYDESQFKLNERGTCVVLKLLHTRGGAPDFNLDLSVKLPESTIRELRWWRSEDHVPKPGLFGPQANHHRWGDRHATITATERGTPNDVDDVIACSMSVPAEQHSK